MSQLWKITEKVIAIFLIIWGAGLLMFEIYGWYQTFQFIHVSWHDFSPTKFLRNYHLDFLLFFIDIVFRYNTITEEKDRLDMFGKHQFVYSF